MPRNKTTLNRKTTCKKEHPLNTICHFCQKTHQRQRFREKILSRHQNKSEKKNCQKRHKGCTLDNNIKAFLTFSNTRLPFISCLQFGSEFASGVVNSFGKFFNTSFSLKYSFITAILDIIVSFILHLPLSYTA